MQSPHHHGGEAGRLRLPYHEVADAGLVPAAGVVDHEDVARCRLLEYLEEDVHAADVPGRGEKKNCSR